MVVLVSGATSVVRHHKAHVGVLVVPAAGNAPEIVSGRQWAMDNGAFSGLDVPLFLKMLRRFVGVLGCLFVAAPDVVGDATRTLEVFAEWEPVIRSFGWPVGFVGQNGLVLSEVPWERCEAVFLGGVPECVPCGYVRPTGQSDERLCPTCGRKLTEWKLGQVARDFAAYAKARGKWVHMGRVNSMSRLRYAMRIGCDSVDGTTFSKWSRKYVPKIEHWVEGFAGGPLIKDLE